MPANVVKVRGTTRFSFQTSILDADVIALAQKITGGFAQAHPDTVQRHSVTKRDSPRLVAVELLTTVGSYGEADGLMRQLCDQIVDQFNGDQRTIVEELATELVPA
jgi:hypothetical protein